MAASKAVTTTPVSFDCQELAQELAKAIKSVEEVKPAQRPSILVRVSRRTLTEKELDSVSLPEKQEGILAKISHSELSQNVLITTVIDNTAMTIQDVEFNKASLADYRFRLPMTNSVNCSKIYSILADLDMSYHAQENGKPKEGGAISFAVLIEADSFDLEKAINDGKFEVVAEGNVSIGFPQAIPSTTKIDLKSELEAAKASRLEQAATSSSLREARRTSRLSNPSVAAMAQTLETSEESMSELATADS